MLATAGVACYGTLIMANVQAALSLRLSINEALHDWQRESGTTTAFWTEGPPIDADGCPDLSLDAVRFMSLDPRFVDFLRKRGVPFIEN
jgi:hypothetical protein